MRLPTKPSVSRHCIGESRSGDVIEPKLTTELMALGDHTGKPPWELSGFFYVSTPLRSSDSGRKYHLKVDHVQLYDHQSSNDEKLNPIQSKCMMRSGEKESVDTTTGVSCPVNVILEVKDSEKVAKKRPEASLHATGFGNAWRYTLGSRNDCVK